jgi:ubiquinol-cytochrome c reductase iron-sulfur subunit
MTDNNETSGATPDEESRVPRRVIGTPAAVATQELLPGEERGKGGGGGDVLDEGTARSAERAAAFFFTLTFLAGLAFIVFYAVWPGHVGDIDRAGRSNLALGIALTVIFLGLAFGLTIWVRHLVTTPEVVQERHAISSTDEDRKVFNQYFEEGTGARCCWPPRRWACCRFSCCAISGRCRRRSCGTPHGRPAPGSSSTAPGCR